jgi:hypothetical protein
MIDAWLKSDLRQIFKEHSVAVLIDESGDAQFLLNTINDQCTIHVANSEIEELHVKYLIEREQPSANKFLIYTLTARSDLKFIREYCETNGCLEIRYLQNYIKEKVHQTLNLNINLPSDELIAAAKVSVGKDQTYWMDLSHKGATEIFDLKKELLPFVHDPEKYEAEKYDQQLREIFYRKVNELLNQGYMPKPAKTLANEVVKAMLDGLAHGECDPTLEAVYNNWLDSINYKSSFDGYLINYSLLSDMDIWSVSPTHPFRQVDEQWLKIIGENIGNKEALPNFLARISRRIQCNQTRALGIVFWTDVKVILEFDPKDISYLNSFSECVDYYSKYFFKIDTAIRNLYTEFLNKRELLEPFQEYYKEMVSIFLDKWFKYFTGYQEQQTGLLQRILDENSQKTAVIVGDGITYEVACQIASRINGSFILTKNTILADIPSETENNMSRIYMANGATEKVHSNREKYLLEQNPDSSIEFIKLDQVNEEAKPSQYLICTYRDIDELGEKLQQKALKYISETTTNFIAEKISQLLNSGYSKVYLITDHGFVLTGILSEADKISVSIEGVHEKAERYIRTVERQHSLTNSYIGVEKKYENYNFIYFSKTINPFKTPGAYGYSHGGVSPQELVTPYFVWERSSSPTQTLKVSLQNKDELKSVTGELFQLKVMAGKGAGDLFSMERKVYLVFFSNKVQINKSDVFTIQRNQIVTKEYTFDENTEIDVLLLDAQTKEQLDRAVVIQNKDRDLSGLL